MATEKSLAIVLRVVEFSETSIVATLFTEEVGKISALAKGARRPKSPFEAALDLLAVCRIVFIHKSSDALDLLTEARLERRFRSASRDLTRLYAGYYTAELLRELTDNGDPHPSLFQAADQTLLALDRGDSVAPTILRFELTALRELGMLPSLETCVGCGEPLDETERVPFGMISGGVLCRRCRSGHHAVVTLSGAAITMLRQLARLEGPAPMPPDPGLGALGELRGFMNNYVAHVLGYRPKTQSFLGAVDPAR